MLTFLTKIGSGYWQMMDPQNGYTAISKSALGRIKLDSIYPYYGYLNDILVKLNVYDGYRVVDVVMPARYGGERSSIKYSKYIVKVSWMLLRDFFWRLKMKYVVLSFHPLVLFGGDLFVRGALSLLVFILGVQFLLFAMLFDMQVNEREGRRWD
jgi:hypothetical protein